MSLMAHVKWWFLSHSVVRITVASFPGAVNARTYDQPTQPRNTTNGTATTRLMIRHHDDRRDRTDHSGRRRPRRRRPPGAAPEPGRGRVKTAARMYSLCPAALRRCAQPG